MGWDAEQGEDLGCGSVRRKRDDGASAEDWGREGGV